MEPTNSFEWWVVDSWFSYAKGLGLSKLGQQQADKNGLQQKVPCPIQSENKIRVKCADLDYKNGQQPNGREVKQSHE